MRAAPPLFLLSGMGADERVFAEQSKALSNLSVPKWIAPEANETLAHYAQRFAAHLDPKAPCVIGGASFGGFVALEMIPHLNVLGCFLIGSARSPEKFPPSFRALRNMARVAGAIPFELANLLSKAALLSSGGLLDQHSTALLSQLADSDAAFLRWACRAVVTWDGPAEPCRVPLFQIHGADDCVLPAHLATGAEFVPGAGHALSLSHPQAITAFLLRHLRALPEPG